MKQEHKDLLLKDLSARLPYGVKVQYEDNIFTIDYISAIYEEIKLDTTDNYTIDVLEVKPYLFPMSSITEEQIEELEGLCDMYVPDDDYYPYAYKGIEILYKHVLDDNYKFKSNFKIDVIEWFYKNHIDYRGLIPMGLAIDATGLNIY